MAMNFLASPKFGYYLGGVLSSVGLVGIGASMGRAPTPVHNDILLIPNRDADGKLMPAKYSWDSNSTIDRTIFVKPISYGQYHEVNETMVGKTHPMSSTFGSPPYTAPDNSPSATIPLPADQAFAVKFFDCVVFALLLYLLWCFWHHFTAAQIPNSTSQSRPDDHDSSDKLKAIFARQLDDLDRKWKCRLEESVAKQKDLGEQLDNRLQQQHSDDIRVRNNSIESAKPNALFAATERIAQLEAQRQEDSEKITTLEEQYAVQAEGILGLLNQQAQVSQEPSVRTDNIPKGRLEKLESLIKDQAKELSKATTKSAELEDKVVLLGRGLLDQSRKYDAELLAIKNATILTIEKTRAAIDKANTHVDEVGPMSFYQSLKADNVQFFELLNGFARMITELQTTARQHDFDIQTLQAVNQATSHYSGYPPFGATHFPPPHQPSTTYPPGGYGMPDTDGESDSEQDIPYHAPNTAQPERRPNMARRGNRSTKAKPRATTSATNYTPSVWPPEDLKMPQGNTAFEAQPQPDQPPIASTQHNLDTNSETPQASSTFQFGHGNTDEPTSVPQSTSTFGFTPINVSTTDAAKPSPLFQPPTQDSFNFGGSGQGSSGGAPMFAFNNEGAASGPKDGEQAKSQFTFGMK